MIGLSSGAFWKMMIVRSLFSREWQSVSYFSAEVEDLCGVVDPMINTTRDPSAPYAEAGLAFPDRGKKKLSAADQHRLDRVFAADADQGLHLGEKQRLGIRPTKTRDTIAITTMTSGEMEGIL
jgi:hypothetical protein